MVVTNNKVHRVGTQRMPKEYLMKVYLIKASAPGPFKEYKKAMGSPPQNIFSVAAATPPEVAVELCDETIDMKPQ